VKHEHEKSAEQRRWCKLLSSAMLRVAPAGRGSLAPRGRPWRGGAQCWTRATGAPPQQRGAWPAPRGARIHSAPSAAAQAPPCASALQRPASERSRMLRQRLRARRVRSAPPPPTRASPSAPG
jgi:hypothetical protein